MNLMRRRFEQVRSTDAGVVAIWVAIMTPLLFMFCAFAVDVARWYVEGERLQKTVDAAALAGVPSMPQDLGAATTAANDMISRNGWSLSSPNITVAIGAGARPSQLKVTMSSTIRNQIAGSFGFPFQTLTRTAVADFNGPAPMGSPCNVFGNEPSSSSVPTSIISSFSNCERNPEFWANVHGPSVWKTQGDQYAVRKCKGNESGCANSSANSDNTEFRPEGYFFTVKVRDPAKTGPITLQIYDPAFVNTDSRCASLPTSGITNGMNALAPDATTRYRNNPLPISATIPSFCTGDTWNGGNRVTSPSADNTDIATITSFGLRKPNDDQVPANGAPITSCARQYAGYDTPSANSLRSSSGAYDAALTGVFHQWVTLCTFTPDPTLLDADYYLQVRTNVPNGNAQAVFSQNGDNASVKGNGSNRFGLRAISSNGQQVSVAGYERMPIFANSDASSTTFNLIRALPGAAGKKIIFKFFDVGDAASNGSVQMLPPLDGRVGPTGTTTMGSLTGCVGTGFQNANLPTCRITGIRSSAGWDGQSQTIEVPIPTDYTCDFNSQGGCWFRVAVSFGSGNVTDATTWTATIDGDPVRIVQ